MQTLKKQLENRVRNFARIGVVFSTALTLIGVAQGEVVVDTIGGGPTASNPKSYGKANGNTFTASQFNGPSGIALDSAGNLYLADKTNNLIRKISNAGDTANSQTTTYVTLPASSRPVGVAVDGDDNLYVLTQTEGRLRKFNLDSSVSNNLNTTLSNPTALALDTNGNIFVTQLNGTVQKIAPNGVKSPDPVTSGLNAPQGIAVMDNGNLMVSDTGNNRILIIDSANGSTITTIGDGTAGFHNGEATQAQFNQPYGLAKAPNGSFVVADRKNHRVRLISTSNSVSTLYGIATNGWDTSYFPGWADGNTNVAASRDPVGVTVATNGTVFTTEYFYHLLRDVTGANLSTTNSGGGGDTNGLGVPTISPTSGYFPSGETIFVDNILGTAYYTTDGTEPTTNSTPVLGGAIQWSDSLHDLTSLRVKNFDGTNSSKTISGQLSSVNEIGVPRDLIAGPGSTVIVPVVINLRSNVQLRSVQFRIEVSPNFGAPAISDQFRSVLISSNDFVPVVRPAAEGAIESMNVSPYTIGDIRGLAASAIGTGANFFVKPFAAVLMLAVPIPADATENQSYTIQVISPSGTSDGQQAAVNLSPILARTITVSTRSYLVGDSSPGTWYNAGDFGDGKLFNSDVNNAFYASFGIRVPYNFTDAFDAMDVGRPGRPDALGGDGLITGYDWQKIYQRSIGLDTSNWARTSARDSEGDHLTIYSTNGNFTTFAARTSGSAESSATIQSPVPPGQVWLRQFVVGAGSVINLSPNAICSIPVYAKVTPGYSLASLQFRATLVPSFGATAPASIQFINSAGSNFQQQSGSGPTDILCSWSMVPSSAFNPQLQGSNFLGYVRFTVPANATSGQSYKLQFSYTDGAPDFNTAYACENLSGFAWVQSAALTAPEVISDQWKTNFFGSVTNVLADANNDPDGDGFNNLQEYQAGTDPLNAQSRLQFSHSEWRNSGARGIALQWLTAPGKVYIVEMSPALVNPVWTGVSTNIGDGNVREFLHTNVTSNIRFYRVRLQP
jgi:sugar lactone lactonase YvrE